MRDPATYPKCEICGNVMALGQRRIHLSCDPTNSVGRPCTCPPKCSKVKVGDQGICDPDCHPCRLTGAKLVKSGRS